MNAKAGVTKLNCDFNQYSNSMSSGSANSDLL